MDAERVKWLRFHTDQSGHDCGGMLIKGPGTSHFQLTAAEDRRANTHTAGRVIVQWMLKEKGQIDCCCHFFFIYLPLALIRLAMQTRAFKYHSVTIRIRKGSCNGKWEICKAGRWDRKDPLCSSNNHLRRDLLLLDGVYEKNSRIMSYSEIIWRWYLMKYRLNVIIYSRALLHVSCKMHEW